MEGPPRRWERDRLPSGLDEGGYLRPPTDKGVSREGEASRHITLLGGKSAKPYKTSIDLAKMSDVPIPRIQVHRRPHVSPPEIAEFASKATRGDRQSYFFALQDQEEWRRYVAALCHVCGFKNPECHRFFHFTVWNSLGGDPYRSISDINERDL